MNAIRSFFELDKYNTTVSREVIAGLTTFTTMSYIVVVNPAILS
jgi:adenine/guanine/hypoxanthine permease